MLVTQCYSICASTLPTSYLLTSSYSFVICIYNYLLFAVDYEIEKKMIFNFCMLGVKFCKLLTSILEIGY